MHWNKALSNKPLLHDVDSNLSYLLDGSEIDMLWGRTDILRCQPNSFQIAEL